MPMSHSLVPPFLPILTSLESLYDNHCTSTWIHISLSLTLSLSLSPPHCKESEEKTMDLDIVNSILNIAAPPISLMTFVLIYPPLLLFRLLLSITKSLFPEDLAGKVVLITGASSGIGEHVAYEYAKRGACLALVARRHHLLEEVAETARYLGSPDVLVIPADVTNVDDCQRSIHQTLQCKSSFKQDTDSNDQKTSCVGRQTRCRQDNSSKMIGKITDPK